MSTNLTIAKVFLRQYFTQSKIGTGTLFLNVVSGFYNCLTHLVGTTPSPFSVLFWQSIQNLFYFKQRGAMTIVGITNRLLSKLIISH